MTDNLARRLFAETLGAALLAGTVIGSGILAVRLAGGNDAVALLGNTLATAAMLYVLIQALGPISGAHFNPAVSLVMALRGEIGWCAFRSLRPLIPAWTSTSVSSLSAGR
jgi:glycerol uptake facilitator-like aquaporin